MTVGALWHFSETHVEACRAARLRRWPGQPGKAALRLDRGDYYGFRDGVPPAPGLLRVALIGDPRTVLISDDRIWWVPRLDQLIERVEAVAKRREPAELPLIRDHIARQLAERIREGGLSWEEVALELLIEQEAAPR